MPERDAFPLQLRQETNTMTVKLLLEMDDLPESFQWSAYLQDPLTYHDRLEEIFGSGAEELINLYIKNQERRLI